ncbi:MAG: hypothetical protein U5R49_20770 [Deltaproteobacteria bacterium]|nr:hypothetical protein [Deltaproteobacteria bacterium]
MDSILLPSSFLLLILFFNSYIYPGASRVNARATLLPRPFCTASFLILVVFVDKKCNFREKSSDFVTVFDKPVWYVKVKGIPAQQVFERAVAEIS